MNSKGTQINEFAWHVIDKDLSLTVYKIMINKENLIRAIEIEGLEGVVQIAVKNITDMIYSSADPNFKGNVTTKEIIIKNLLEH